MDLLILDDNYDVVLNVVWIKTNPKLNALINRDKGMRIIPKEGSTYFDKVKAKKDFKLLTLLLNPDSEYSGMDEQTRLDNSLLLLNMKESEFYNDEILQEAIVEYEKILNSLPSYRSFLSVKKSIDKKITYIENINFEDVDKQGRLKITPSDHSKAIEGLAKDLKYQDEFEKKYNQDYADKNNRFKKSLTISSIEKNTNNNDEWIENINGL
mgnify:CR=1 FL=1